MSVKLKPKITVITVVFDDVDGFDKTIRSVLNQTYADIEYIVIDGGSTDGTKDLIKYYDNVIDYWISESDKGIYDAMNKGICRSNGDFINFMNAGDCFYNQDTVSNIFNNNNVTAVDIIYGSHKVHPSRNNREVRPGPFSNIYQGSQFSHQSAFISTKLHKFFKYNINNKISADFEFFYYSYLDNRRFKCVKEVVSVVSRGGVSDIKRIESIVSWWNIVDKSFKTNTYYIFRIIREIIVKKIKDCINIK